MLGRFWGVILKRILCYHDACFHNGDAEIPVVGEKDMLGIAKPLSRPTARVSH